MATLTIDGKSCSFDGKKMILQVALENGVEIPHYCYHEGLSIVASCRICLAEVAAPNPRNKNTIELIPKLMPTCQTMATDGMEVYIKSPKSLANQKAVMEYLLINHPIDCPVCDQAGECSLQDYSYKYGRSTSRFEDDKIKQPKKDIGPNVLLYSDRCIMCSLCVRFTREVSGTSEIGIFGRGNQEQIDVFPGNPLDNELSANVIDLCPVGALLDKDFLFEQRVWYLTETPSIDGITASGDNISIHHNEGQIYRIKPRTNMQVNKWWISDEIRYGWKFAHSDDRLRSPARQQYNVQVECGWDRAYGDARDGLQKVVNEKGPGSLALMVSPMLSCEEAYLLASFLRGLDQQALLAVGPVPIEGQDKTFPGGYTVYSEKCPNSRGVRSALDDFDGQVLDYQALLDQLNDKQSNIGGVVLTGNYPAAWPSNDLAKAVNKRFLLMIDTLANSLSARADVLLPGATWAEKSGTFENANNLLQSFDQAINVIEQAKNEGQIALDLAAACGLADKQIYEPKSVRQQMGGVFADQVQYPARAEPSETDLQYVEL